MCINSIPFLLVLAAHFTPGFAGVSSICRVLLRLAVKDAGQRKDSAPKNQTYMKCGLSNQARTKGRSNGEKI